MQEKIGKVRKTGCFECRVPQRVCIRWTDNGKGGFRQTGKHCQYEGVMVSVIVGILDSYDRVRREWSKRLEKEGININDYKALGAYLKT